MTTESDNLVIDVGIFEPPKLVDETVFFFLPGREVRETFESSTMKFVFLNVVFAALNKLEDDLEFYCIPECRNETCDCL